MLTLFSHALLISIKPSSNILLNILTHNTPNGCRFSFRARLWALPRDVAENHIQLILLPRENLPLFWERLGSNGGNIRSPTTNRLGDEGENHAENPERQRERAPELHHGTCSSWAVLLASKIAEDPNDLYFVDVGHHKLAFTRSGIFIDSSVREAIQLKDGVDYKFKNITCSLKGIGQDKPGGEA